MCVVRLVRSRLLLVINLALCQRKSHERAVSSQVLLLRTVIIGDHVVKLRHNQCYEFNISVFVVLDWLENTWSGHQDFFSHMLLFIVA